MGVVLCIACGALAIGRARNEGRNVQFIAPLLLAGGVCIMHFVGMAAITITPNTTIPIPPKTIDPTILGYFVGAMTMLLMGTGVATMMIARGARQGSADATEEYRRCLGRRTDPDQRRRPSST